MTDPIFAKVGGLNVISQVTVIRMGPPGSGGGGTGGTPSAHAASHTTGSDIIPAATTSTPGLMPPTAVTKLAGIATGATANATDAALRDRGTHTGTQTVATLSDFTEAVQDAVAGLLGAGSNVTLTYNDASNTLTVSAASAGTGLDAEAVRDAIGIALVGVGNIAVTVNDAADTITISTTATANSTDAQLRDRTTHTGQQTASTISDFAETARDVVGAALAAGTHTGITVTVDDAGDKISLAAAGGGGVTSYATLPTVGAEGALAFVQADDQVYRSSGVSWLPESPRQSIYNTDAGLRKWRAQMAALDAGEVIKPAMLFLGDSITEGGGAGGLTGGAAWRDLGYVGVLRSLMAQRWGDVGTGIIPPYSWEESSPVVPAWTRTGTWTYDNTFGIAGRSLRADFAASGNSGATASTSFSGTGVNVHMIRGNITCKIAVYIDGTLNTTFDSYSASTQHYALPITGLTDATHTLELRYGGASASSASATNFWLVGATPMRGTRGVVVHNHGYWGKTADWFTVNENVLIDSVDIHAPVLTVIAFGANEYANQFPLATYETHLQTLITRGKTFGDVLLFATGYWTDKNPTITRAQYVAVMRKLAIINGVAFADLEALWKDGATSAALGLLHDNVHPNTRGHRALALFLSEILGLDLPATAGHTHAIATTTDAGFMSAADKVKLDSLSSAGNPFLTGANWTGGTVGNIVFRTGPTTVVDADPSMLLEVRRGKLYYKYAEGQFYAPGTVIPAVAGAFTTTEANEQRFVALTSKTSNTGRNLATYIGPGISDAYAATPVSAGLELGSIETTGFWRFTPTPPFFEAPAVTQWFENFSAMTTGAVPTAGIIDPLWVTTDQTLSVVVDTADATNKVLKQTRGASSPRSVLAYTPAGQRVAHKISIRGRMLGAVGGAGARQFRAILRASGGAGTESAWVASLDGAGVLQFFSYAAGVVSTGSPIATTNLPTGVLITGQWYQVDFEVALNRLMARGFIARNITVTTAAPISATATNLTVGALPAAIPAASVLEFGGVYVTTSAAVAAGVTSLPVTAVPAAIAANTQGHVVPAYMITANSDRVPAAGFAGFSGHGNANGGVTEWDYVSVTTGDGELRVI